MHGVAGEPCVADPSRRTQGCFGVGGGGAGDEMSKTRAADEAMILDGADLLERRAVRCRELVHLRAGWRGVRHSLRPAGGGRQRENEPAPDRPTASANVSSFRRPRRERRGTTAPSAYRTLLPPTRGWGSDARARSGVPLPRRIQLTNSVSPLRAEVRRKGPWRDKNRKALGVEALFLAQFDLCSSIKRE